MSRVRIPSPALRAGPGGSASRPSLSRGLPAFALRRQRSGCSRIRCRDCGLRGLSSNPFARSSRRSPRLRLPTFAQSRAPCLRVAKAAQRMLTHPLPGLRTSRTQFESLRPLFARDANAERGVPQYLGTAASIILDHASIPPAKLRTSSNPARRSASVTSRLLTPWWQYTTMHASSCSRRASM